MRRGFSLSRATLASRGKSSENTRTRDLSGRALDVQREIHAEKGFSGLRPLGFAGVSIFAEVIALAPMRSVLAARSRRRALSCEKSDVEANPHSQSAMATNLDLVLLSLYELFMT